MSEPAYTRLDVDTRRRRLLEKGAYLFARYSYDELSMASIARSAGVSKALLYHYFPSKQAYFSATLEQARPSSRRSSTPRPPPRSSSTRSSAGSSHAAAPTRRSWRRGAQVRELMEAVRAATAERILAALPGEPSPRRRTAVHAWLWFMDGAILDWLEHRDLERAELHALLMDALEGVLGSSAS